MAKELYFYKVRTLQTPYPAIIDLDKDHIPDNVMRVLLERAEPWEKRIGTRHIIRFTTIDMFDAVEKIFGKRPKNAVADSRFYLSDNDSSASIEFHFSDGSTEKLTRAQLRPYYYKKSQEEYLFERETVAVIEGYSLPSSLETGDYLTGSDILNAVEQYVREHGEDGAAHQMYTAPVYELMRIYTMIKDGEQLICSAD